MEKLVKSIADQINKKIGVVPDCAIILGSGLSEEMDKLQDKIFISYSEINGMPTTRVEGHKNQFICGKLHNKVVLAMQGRFHLYDGFTAKQACLPIYVFKELGIKTLILTNASGGVNSSFMPGDIMLIEDHINNTHTNALIGGPIINYGEQFIDMSEPYDKKYREIVKAVASEKSIELKTGVYAQFIGPFYETKADVKMIQKLGVDAVGMSTVIETEAARQCGLRVLALSVISNMATGISSKRMSHEDVLSMVKVSSSNLYELISGFISKL